MNIAVGEGDVCLKEKITRVVGVEFYRTVDIIVGFFGAVEVEEHLRTCCKQLGVVGVFLKVDVKKFKFDAVGHVLFYLMGFAASKEDGEC